MAKQELSKLSDEKLKGVAIKRDPRRVKEKDRILTPEDRGHPDWAHYGAHQEVAKLLKQIISMKAGVCPMYSPPS